MKQLNPAQFHAILRIMNRHCGAENAITLADLSKETGINRRDVEVVLQTCKDDFPFIVVGSGSGMYVATNVDDLNHEIASRQSRIKNIQIGITAVKRKALALGWKMEGERFTSAPRQTEMELF